MVKIKSDALIILDKEAAGFITKDHYDRLLRAGGKCFHPSSIPHVELMAIWIGLYIATVKLQTQFIWLEGDSSMVMKWIFNLITCWRS